VKIHAKFNILREKNVNALKILFCSFQKKVEKILTLINPFIRRNDIVFNIKKYLRDYIKDYAKMSMYNLRLIGEICGLKVRLI
jgi:hypothetical protein